MTTATASAVAEKAVSERLAEHTVGLRFEDLPSEVVERAKDLLINQLALAFAGRTTELGQRAIALAHELSAGGGRSTLVGERIPVTLPEGVFAHSALMGQVLDDLSFPSALHIGRITHPVAWLVGERQRSSGRELITAVVLGYDIGCALVDPAMLRDYLRLPQFVFPPIAAAAVASRLLSHDEPRAAHAMGYAAHLGAGLVEGHEPTTSGIQARNGLMAALLARPRAERLRTIEGKRGLFQSFFGRSAEGLEAALVSLGHEFLIMGTSTKRFPGSGSHVLALDFLTEIIDEARADRVERVVVTLDEGFRERFDHLEAGIDRPDPTEHEVVSSLRVKLALLLARGERVYQPARADLEKPGVREALGRLALRFEEGRGLEYGRVEATTAAGRVLRREGTFRPYPKGDWSAWIRRDTEGVLPEKQIAELERLLVHLEDVRDVGDVLRNTVPDGPTLSTR